MGSVGNGPISSLSHANQCQRAETEPLCLSGIMGCIASKIEDEEAVRRSKERKKLIKQLLTCRARLASAHFAYLKSLRDTGSALRQFVEVESPVDPTKTPPRTITLPPSPPPLPPSPPPLPQFSPMVHKHNRQLPENSTRDNYSEIDSETESCVTPRPPPPPPGVDWRLWDPFDAAVTLNSPILLNNRNMINYSRKDWDDEDWEETNTDYEEDDKGSKFEGEIGKGEILGTESKEDNMSQASWHTKESDVAPLAMCRNKKSLIEIVKEIDEHFLKAAAGGQDVVSFLEIDSGRLRPWEIDGKKGKKLKSAKVFTTLSFNRSFKFPQANDIDKSLQHSISNNYSHGNTLYKILEEEQRLYKLVMDEEHTKISFQKNISELQKIETGNHDMIQAEKMREKIDELQIRKVSLREAVNVTSMSIVVLRDEELFPQLIELSAGLAHMWREMYECHQVQTHVAQKVHLLENRPGHDPTTDLHWEAARQLETEVTNWQASFCKLVSSQRAYIQTLHQWVQLTDGFPDPGGFMGPGTGIRALCEDLNHVFDKLPEKAVGDSIKNFLSVIHSIVLQQAEERRLKKRADLYEVKLEKRLASLGHFDKHGPGTITSQDPLFKDPKIDSLKRRVEEEKTKYLNSVRVSRAMSVKNLQTGLPNVFQGLTGFSKICVEAFEGINGSGGATIATRS
ncbi:hypothetical protein LUZ62_049912 [Rhynchospora pubera]|uniref:DUF632 domain-containing protein n=1 Tax=Rhynchospora pubera TaxID=906938 RepID=A0AAV8G4H4_9POAL|nr:hypothetical protein LUZ62_049912 [Rhynchospora pubera]